MDKFGHNLSFVIVFILLFIWRLIIGKLDIFVFGGFIIAYKLSNPDDDIEITKFIIKKIEVKEGRLNVINPGLHRWFLTHSILYPLIIYELGIKYFDSSNIKEFGFLMFLCVTIHLFLDFRIKHLIEDTSKGTWLISIFPINYIIYYFFRIITLGLWKPIKIRKYKKLTKYPSYFWMILNSIITLLYTIWVFGINIFSISF